MPKAASLKVMELLQAGRPPLAGAAQAAGEQGHQPALVGSSTRPGSAGRPPRVQVRAPGIRVV